MLLIWEFRDEYNTALVLNRGGAGGESGPMVSWDPEESES